MNRWIDLVIRRRFPVLIAWLIVVVLGIFATAHINDRLTTSLAVPGSQSAEAEAVAAKAFAENTEGTFTIFYKFKQATKPEIELIKQKIELSVSTIPNAKILQSRAVAGVLFASVGTNFDLTDAAAYTEPLRAALKQNGLTSVQVTGPPAIKSDVTPVLAQDLHRGEIFGAVIGLALLILILGFSWAAVIPLIFAAATISTTLGLVWLLSHKLLMVLYIPNIVELIGLGLAIDYSLLMVQRFRREGSVEQTMQTAGRTILFSSTTVAFGLATLLLVPVPFIRSLGFAGVLVPIVSLLATLTLQPVLLSYLGTNGLRTYGFHGVLSRRDLHQKFVGVVIRKPRLTMVASLMVLALLILPLFALHVTPSSLTAIPKNLESGKALSVVTNIAGSGSITPSEIVIDLGSPGKAEHVNKARIELTSHVSSDPEVFLVASGEKSPYVDATGRYLRIYVVGKNDVGSSKTHELVNKLRTYYLMKTSFPDSTHLYLAGAPAQGVDLLDRIFTALPWIVALILILTLALLYRAFRSIVLPIKAILLDLISVAVSLAGVVAVVQYGFGSSLLGTYHLPDIEAWVLIFLFAILFGVSMDYEVFIVSRMREAWDRGSSNEAAIMEGMVETGGVVTAAAAILVVAVSGLAFGHFAGLQQLGIGLAVGIIIDATVIRGLLLPSSMVLLGKWNWYRPHK